MKGSPTKEERRVRRHRRIRARIIGTAERPRLAVFKSNTRMTAQIIDDEKNVTIAAVSTASSKKASMKERIEEVAALLAASEQAKKITSVVFDRGGFIYAGNIKLFADTLRKSGLAF